MGDNDDVVMITAGEFEVAVRNDPPRFKYNDVWFFINVPKGNVLRLPKYLLKNAPELKKGTFYPCVDIDDRVHMWGLIDEKNRKKPNLTVSSGWRKYVRLCGYKPGDEIWMVFKRREQKFEFAWDDVHNFD